LERDDEMRRAERLFDIIQRLRSHGHAMPAARLAEQLEVSVRTIYRDIAHMQGSGVPIEGESGVGYLLRAGFDLPPLMFTAEEMQTIAVALDLVRRTGDRGLQEAAAAVRSKISAVSPCGTRAVPYYVSTQGASVAAIVCMSDLRDAIRAARKLRIGYRDCAGQESCRVIWPLAVAYFADSTLIGAWCELRGDYRHFRTDRVRDLAILTDVYPAQQSGLLAGWRALHEPAC
jgi:predicted DNA-binding transcriptional regulator YafY